MVVDQLVERMVGRGKRSSRRKPAPMPLWPLQIPHLAFPGRWTRAVAEGSRRLTAWATTQQKIPYSRGLVWKLTVSQLVKKFLPVCGKRRILTVVIRAGYMIRVISTMKTIVFSDVTPCSSCENRRFGGMCRLHHLGELLVTDNIISSFSRWWWRYIPPKPWFSQEPQGVTSQ
jgi:hypothetical protein